MELDLREVETVDFDGQSSIRDISKELANTIYKMTPDLGELSFAQDLYKNGTVAVSQANFDIIKKYMEEAQFLAFVKKVVYDKMDNLLKQE